MNKTTTNIMGIIIVILAGTYFFIMYCNLCSPDREVSYLPEINTPLPTEAGVLS